MGHYGLWPKSQSISKYLNGGEITKHNSCLSLDLFKRNYKHTHTSAYSGQINHDHVVTGQGLRGSRGNLPTILWEMLQ